MIGQNGDKQGWSVSLGLASIRVAMGVVNFPLRCFRAGMIDFAQCKEASFRLIKSCIIYSIQLLTN